eukprot:TRINITY_DN1923_c0_g1_i1.p1 TRINITY_DN1923_c0_g1~~TRINITY_DN1923_c0_g1_i1.p1  ORF type:complete len:162 (+),score=24.43 TRINITY_DN1923_c0_g1_i1:290-775(+)
MVLFMEGTEQQKLSNLLSGTCKEQFDHIQSFSNIQHHSDQKNGASTCQLIGGGYCTNKGQIQINQKNQTVGGNVCLPNNCLDSMSMRILADWMLEQAAKKRETSATSKLTITLEVNCKNAGGNVALVREVFEPKQRSFGSRRAQISLSAITSILTVVGLSH